MLGGTTLEKACTTEPEKMPEEALGWRLENEEEEKRSEIMDGETDSEREKPSGT